MSEQPQTGADTCLRCGAQLSSMAVEKFRVGGTGGGWKMLFGELAQLSEGMIPFEVFACQQCRRVELLVAAAQ